MYLDVECDGELLGMASVEVVFPVDFPVFSFMSKNLAINLAPNADILEMSVADSSAVIFTSSA